MAESITIDKTNKLPQAQDYDFLRKEGIDLIQNLSGDVWSDYNTHDPGITLLEAICYALTDLGYRTAYDIKDILAPEKFSADTWKKVFYTAREILPCNPLTLIDFRKLIIDTEGVRNAWIEKSDEYEVLLYLQQKQNREGSSSKFNLTYDAKKGEEVLRLRGLYKVFVEYEDYIISEKKEEHVADIVRQKLQHHRNLCEDFVSVSSIEYEYFPIEAVVQVKEGSDIETITAKIYKVIYDFFSPSVAFYTLEQMLEKNASAEDIFSGPVLKYGFIDTEELITSEQYRDIHLSDIIRLISGVEGVIAIKKFSFGQSDSRFGNFNEWVNNVKDKQKIPKLDITNSLITFVRSGDRHRQEKNNRADNKKAEMIFSFLQASDLRSRLKGISKDLVVPAGEYMNIANYYPFQQSLPAIYGMADQLLEDKADHAAIMNAVNELLDAKVGIYLRTLLNRLLVEAEERDDLKKSIRHLLTEAKDEASVKKVFDSLLEEQKYHSLIKKIMPELSAEEKHVPVREQIHHLIDVQFKTKPPYISGKTKILEHVARSTGEHSLVQVNTSDEIERLNSAYKKHQINSLGRQKKLALQLRGFLMVFEQILADYLSQLAHTRELFSFNSSIEQTYFPQVLQEIQDMEALFINFEKYKNEQIRLSETEESFIKRRTNILDHLLSRFAETLDKYAYFMRQYAGKKAGEKLISDKINFLSDYVDISNYRARGYDYTNSDKSWNSDNVEIFKKRICRMLGIENYSRRNIAPRNIYIEEITLDERDDKNEKVIRYVVLLKDAGNTDEVLLRSTEYEFETEARQILNYILEHGSEQALYKVEGSKDKWTYHLKRKIENDAYESVAHSRHFKSEYELDEVFKKTIETLNGFSGDENFHVIDHILLRPKVEPRESFGKKPSSTINSDKVELLSVRSIADKKLIDEDKEIEELLYKFKITQIRDTDRNNKTIWKLGLVKENEEMLFVRDEFSFYKHLTRRIEQIRNTGADIENYISATGADGIMNFKLMTGNNYLAESKKNYRKKEDLDADIANLVNFFSYELAFVSGETDDSDFSYYADPYSLQVSILIPGWHKRFRSPAFRHLFEKTIYLETPSHIYPHIYWLDHKEMREFEEAYKLWVQEMASPALPDTDIVNNLIAKINELRK
jgi:hypothetical protein